VTAAADARLAARASALSAGARSLRLDAFRGLAAIFMIVNHAGYELLDAAAAASGWQGVLVFIGSTAPALFFFATGVGAGFSSGGRESWMSLLRKVGLLLMAGILMSWSAGGLPNFDFFGFAALATLVLFLVRRSPRPVLTAWLLLALVMFMRFGLAPLARGRIEPNTLAAFVTGIAPCWFVSYPIGPWLAFPLLGFLMGRRWPASSAARGEAWLIGGLGLATLVAAGGLAHFGAPVFRWASVSIAYFLFAVGTIALAWLALALVVRASAATAAALALRGPSSLLIVPLHYGALGLVGSVWLAGRDVGPWLAVTALVAATVLVLSRALIAAASARSTPSAPAQWAVFTGAVAVCGAAYLFASPLPRLELCSAGEVVMGLLLLWSTRQGTARPVAAVLASS
jgi:hypothetical protein